MCEPYRRPRASVCASTEPPRRRAHESRRRIMAKQPRILAGENAAITGGARGIGRATAQALLEKGMRVALGDIDADPARATAAELGPRCVGLPLDVTDRDSFSAFLGGDEEQVGPLDVLVNNPDMLQDS